ncbi:hypothetical protein BANRA_00013 [Klebsiella pneumoniae]|nr:hypothetical protein BANRA_00013 [Klebsiella pneumoniae]
MFKPFTLVAVGLSLALSGAALAKENRLHVPGAGGRQADHGDDPRH